MLKFRASLVNEFRLPMPNYPNVRHCLYTVFSPDLALSEHAAVAMLVRTARNAGVTEALRKELAELSADESTSWRELLDEFDVLYAASEEEAREWVQRCFVAPLENAT